MPAFLDTKSFFPDIKHKVRSAQNYLRLAEPMRTCSHPRECCMPHDNYFFCAKCLTLFGDDPNA